MGNVKSILHTRDIESLSGIYLWLFRINTPIETVVHYQDKTRLWLFEILLAQETAFSTRKSVIQVVEKEFSLILDTTKTNKLTSQNVSILADIIASKMFERVTAIAHKVSIDQAECVRSPSFTDGDAINILRPILAKPHEKLTRHEEVAWNALCKIVRSTRHPMPCTSL